MLKRSREEVSQDKEIQQFDLIVKIAKLQKIIEHESDQEKRQEKETLKNSLWNEFNELKLKSNEQNS